VTDLLEVTAHVIGAEAAGVRYSVGGWLASSFLRALGDEFYADAEALHRAILTGTSTNLIHQRAERQTSAR
jgi:hypothetical protein